MKRLYNIYIMSAVSLMILFSGCSEDDGVIGGYGHREPIVLAADYQTTTRVTDAGFADGDRMGVFIMDYDNGKPSEMLLEDNRADNVLFTFVESENRWQGATTIYWRNDQTPIDVVGYYPFNNDLSSVTDYAFSVQSRQDKAATNAAKGGYEQSDFLWAKCTNVAPTSDVIRLLYKHRMAGVTVRLVEGTGFADGEWAKSIKQVWVDNTTLDASVDLATGTVTAVDGNVQKIVPLEANGEYRAVVVPQVVAAKKALIGIDIDGATYQRVMDSDMIYYSGKMHTFTIQVNKRTDTGDYEFCVTDESVTPWVDDMEFHDGLLREYVVVDVKTPGTFAQCLKDKGFDYKAVSSLKVSGKVDWKDLDFMGHSMPALTHLNLYDVIIDDENDENDDVITGFDSQVDQVFTQLTKIVLPKRLRGIGNGAFCRTGLTGSITIPEGVTFIGDVAFVDCPLYAEIKFPSTLKRIGISAFQYSKLSGEVHLPEGIEYVGDGAFAGTKVEGSLHLPSSLKTVGGGAFGAGFTGTLVIPQGVEFTGGAFEGAQFSHVEIPEGLKVIHGFMFKSVPLQGELLLPSTVTELGSFSFYESKITSVVLPDNLKSLEGGSFAECSRLEGVIEIPRGIKVLNEAVFCGCTMLDGVRLHKDVVYIAKRAFERCYNMSSIICEAEEPPVIEEGAFDAVPKDNFTVEVPAKSVALYKQAAGWKEFKRISAYSNFVCRPAQACAINSRHDEELILNADSDWTVTHIPDWCQLSQTSGNGKTALRLTINEMARGSEDRSDSIVFELNGGQYTTYCAVKQCDYEYNEDELVALQTHTKGNGIDVVFVGDGYDAQDLSDGKFIDLAKEQMEHFFGLPPYDRLRDYFNVYAAVALSQEKGINTVNSYYNTRFGTIYGGSYEVTCCTQTGLIPNDELIFQYVKALTGKSDWDMSRTVVVLIPNTTEYDAVTYLYDDGRAIAICPESTKAYPDDTRGVVQREVGGFAFAKLANEKATKHAFPKRSLLNGVKEMQDWRGWYKNISITGKLSDVPWAHYVFDSRYSDYVDVFEGAYGYTRYFYRSESQSCMNTGIPYYNTISRELITRRVMDYAGEPFSMEDFYAKDTNKWGESGMTTRSGADGYPSELRSSIQHPVIVKGKYIPNKPKTKKRPE